MIRKFAKPLALSMVLSLSVLLFASCGKEQSNTAGNDTAAKANSTAKANLTQEQAPELNKEAKLKIGVPSNSGAGGFEQGANENDNQFLNAIREKTGYKNIEWNIVDQATQLDKYNLMFASGDVYDIIYNNNLDLFRRYSGQGVLEPVDAVLSKYGSEVGKLVTENAWAMVTLEGKKYAIPVPAYQQYNKIDVGSGFLARQDWMDKSGLKAPKNVDDLYTFLKTIKDKDPSGKGTIPYVGAAGSNGNPFDSLDVITSAFGMQGITGLAVPFIVKDGKLVDAQDYYLKDCLTYLAKLYKEGLIDNEYLFNKAQQVTEKMSAGKSASFYAGYWNVKPLQDALDKIDPDARLTFLPPVEGMDGTKGYVMAAPVSAYFMIPKGAKNSNEAVDLLNSYLKDKDLQQFVNFGKEGVHYDMVNGVFTPKQPAYDGIKYKFFYRLWNSPEIWLPNALLAGFEPAMKSITANGPQLTVFNINQYRPQTDVELSKGKTLLDLRNEYAAKIINGALPVTAVDEYFKKADAAGRQDVIKASQDWFTKEGKAISDKLNKN